MAALVTALEPGTLTYRQDGTILRLKLGGGFAEVRDNVMTVPRGLGRDGGG